MKQHPSSPCFADIILGQRKVKQFFFSQINQIIDWSPIRRIIETAYTKGNKATGRPSYDSMVLFKTELLRTWYGLSDGEVEDQVNDRLSFSHFVGLGMEDVAPDSTTVCRFRNILVEAGLYDTILNEINRQLEEKGVIVKRGAIVDASITDTPRRPRGRKEYEVVEDRNEEDGRESSEKAMLKEVVKSNVDGDARWVKKMGKLHFGYKRHTVTDENGLVLAEETTAANESDIKHLETPLKKADLPQGTPVYTDKGYDSAENKKIIGKLKLKSRIMHKGTKVRKITEREQRINVAISKIRYRVERTFGSIHRWFLGGVARYVGLEKTHAQHMMEAMAYNLYRSPGIIVSNSLK
ncbi:IS5 family transposase [Bacteroides pyogenes]|uniref:IS5 family transposase n=1 Tax=Bacteroides pyogenes TaxID=310300 RepID=UPI001BAC5CF0|nr:IS5 family transposase [Bacteroides pyogenes]MBR8706962.1 IS5 family transposase ISPg8 [Bacteroides pyogenes]